MCPPEKFVVVKFGKVRGCEGKQNFNGVAGFLTQPGDADDILINIFPLNL